MLGKSRHIFDGINFLGGQSSSRPFGAAVLDELILILISREVRYKPNIGDDLARYLSVIFAAIRSCCLDGIDLISREVQTNIGMILPGTYQGIAKEFTAGNVGNLEDSWKQWISAIPATKIFLGLPAAPQAAGSGFIPAGDLTSKVLPVIKGL
ncbi:hypothetical protein HHK36_000044 [Tetracentron sinense]|uniref:Uncharacterized protein n=1 Tax=Tetracentron sinense TaxID=13715 RepID=A0A834ZV97_TETSI|nr:hypothetical protein HHK36_000044 [Tetracentron sinense]